ncbi:TolC family protein [Bacteroidales bacterium]|nr:TolC family protein [Bacteroidales bacterium]
MRYLVFIYMIGLSTLPSFAESAFTPQQCFELAKQNHPARLQQEQLKQIYALQKQITRTMRLPQFNIEGQASYQSDVITLDLPSSIPGLSLPSMPKDQFKLNTNIHQLIYDGGLTKNKHEFQKADLNTKLQELEIELYQQQFQISDIFFQYFILHENKKALQSAIDILHKQEKSIQSSVKNGILLRSDIMLIQSEIINTEQNFQQVLLSINATKEILSIMVDSSMRSAQLLLPKHNHIDTLTNTRPEYILFDYQKEKLEYAEKLKASEIKPIVNGFGTLGYGKPGLNMLNNKADNYYIVGINCKLPLWNWQKNKREQEVLKLQANIIVHQQTTFDRSIRIQKINLQNNFEILKHRILADKALIGKQNNILELFDVQLKNGTITANDYLSQLNKVTQATISLSSHQIQLKKIIVEYNLLIGSYASTSLNKQ